MIVETLTTMRSSVVNRRGCVVYSDYSVNKNFKRCKRNLLTCIVYAFHQRPFDIFLFNLRINKKKKAIQCKKGRQRRLFMYWVSLKRKERQRNCVMRWNLHKNTAETFLDRSNNKMGNYITNMMDPIQNG